MHAITLQEMAESLILARLLVRGARPPARRDVQKSLDSLFVQRLGTTEWRTVFSTAFDRLVELEQVTQRPLALTVAGRDRALGFWQIAEVPPRIRWEALKRQYIVPRVLGLSCRQLSGKDKTKSLIAAVLKARYQLPADTGDSPAAIVNALAWRQLNIEATARFTPQAVVAKTLLDSTRNPTADQVATSLARLAFDTAGNDLFAGALRQWIATGQIDAAIQPNRFDAPTIKTSTTNGVSSPSGFSAVDQCPEDMTAFVANTLAAAAQSHTGQLQADATPAGGFGDNKVFISQAWNRLQNRPEFAALTLGRFKERLVEAHRCQLLELCRADLVERMDARDVAESETRYLDGVFHLLRIDNQGRQS